MKGPEHTDRARVERELTDMAKFPEMNPGPVCRLDREGKVLLANEKAKKLFGERRLIGSLWQTICPGIDNEVWDRICSSEVPYPFESEISDCVYLYTYTLSDSKEYVFAFGADITARRKGEIQLAEQAALLAELARFPEMNPGPVVRTDLEGNIVLENTAAEALFGEELVGRNWKEICPGMLDALWGKILEGRETIFFEATIASREYLFAHRREVRGRFVFIFGSDISQQKRAERALRQSEKMATLGTLAAGVAHELNNPAAATRRASEQLRAAFSRFDQARICLEGKAFTDVQKNEMRGLEQEARQCSASRLVTDSLLLADVEEEIEHWLDQQQIDQAWELASSLAMLKMSAERLDRLKTLFSGELLPVVLEWMASMVSVHSLLDEIAQGSSRISEIVGALKSYSYLGQAPVQNVNVHEGIDNTLIILRNKLKTGIRVVRKYGLQVPSIIARGSELNQVWTNILDNAVDAMNGQGEIVITTSTYEGAVAVEIEDNGPGIPPELQSRVFDPFFTTKAPGKGTGLGLSNSHTIITERHHGSITLSSTPGHTKFTVTLPLDPGP